MNDSIKRISLDIHSASSGETVKAKRGDTARKIYISLVDGGRPYIISEDCYAVFTGKKPDDKVVYNDCTIKDNMIIYAFTEQTVAVEGRVSCEIKLYGANGKLITSPKFTIIVHDTVYDEGDEVESSDEFNALTSLVADTLNAVKDAQDANKAAQEAIKVAKEMEASLLITDASGSAISIDDAAEHSLIGLKIYGKTTQNGTPTPDAPVEMVSVGDSGSITVNVTGEDEKQSMTVATPNGLPGIPVASGGNYTDANGQQWICDEIDFARGVYVQRIAEKVFDGTEIWVTVSDANVFGYQGLSPMMVPQYGLCSHSSDNRVVGTGFMEDKSYTLRTQGFIYFKDTGISTVEEWKRWLVEQYAAGTPVTIQYIPSIPIETPLSEEELAAYASLYTYRDNTTVSNDAGAWMDLEYVMDAKKYIDSLVSGNIPQSTGTILPATVE